MSAPLSPHVMEWLFRNEHAFITMVLKRYYGMTDYRFLVASSEPPGDPFFRLNVEPEGKYFSRFSSLV